MKIRILLQKGFLTPLCLYFEHGKTKRVTFFLPPLFSSDWSLDNFSRQIHTERFDHFLFNENNILSIYIWERPCMKSDNFGWFSTPLPTMIEILTYNVQFLGILLDPPTSLPQNRSLLMDVPLAISFDSKLLLAAKYTLGNYTKLCLDKT